MGSIPNELASKIFWKLSLCKYKNKYSGGNFVGRITKEWVGANIFSLGSR